MTHLRRYLPPLLLLLPVIFICGKLLLTPVPGRPQWPDRQLSSQLGALTKFLKRRERGGRGEEFK